MPKNTLSRVIYATKELNEVKELKEVDASFILMLLDMLSGLHLNYDGFTFMLCCVFGLLCRYSNALSNKD